MPGPNAPYTALDANQVITHVYDEVNDRLRTDATLNVGSATIQVSTSHVDDSIRLGDGTNLTTATVIGPKVGLDVNMINPYIKISDGLGTNLAINSDGGVNAILQNSIIPFKFDSIYPTYPTSTTEIYTYKNIGVTVAILTVTYVDATKNEIVSVIRT